MYNSKLTVGLVSAFLLVALFACQHELVLPTVQHNPGVPCSTDTVYFQNQLLPLLVSTCAMATCHNTQYHTLGFDMTTYAGVMKLVVPANAESSVLYTVITNSEPTDKMPIWPAPVWTPAQSDLLKKWIDQGALDNACDEDAAECDTSRLTYTNFIQPLVASHCLGCHVQAAWGGGVVLNTYADLKASTQGGRLYGAVAWQGGHLSMPKFQKQLPACVVRKVEVWIQNGMPQ